MEMEFLKQQQSDMISVGDEIVLFNCEEAMLNGPHTVASLTEQGEVTLVGIRSNGGKVSVVYI